MIATMTYAGMRCGTLRSMMMGMMRMCNRYGRV